jgi:hypothetical protein
LLLGELLDSFTTREAPEVRVWVNTFGAISRTAVQFLSGFCVFRWSGVRISNSCELLRPRQEADAFCNSLVFVHGLGSNPDTTWRAPKKADSEESSADALKLSEYVTWITHFLPDDLPAELLPQTRLYFYNYDSDWRRDAVEVKLKDLGEDLLRTVGEDLRNPETVGGRTSLFAVLQFKILNN